MKAKTQAAAAQARSEAKAAEMERIAQAARADRHNITLYNDCLNRYVNVMRKRLNEVETFYGQPELQQIHETAKNASLSEVCSSNSN